MQRLYAGKGLHVHFKMQSVFIKYFLLTFVPGYSVIQLCETTF